jgi:hypothetical protein
VRLALAALLLTSCSATEAAPNPGLLDRNGEPPAINMPAEAPESPPAARGEPIQVQPPPKPVYSPPEDAQCPQWHEMALLAGWEIEHLDRLDYIIWRESRCLPNAHNKADPVTGSRGLMQINGFWCLKSRWEPHPAGYLGNIGIINSCEDLFDPILNLRAGKAIYDYGVERGQCPWRPWSTRNTSWCG